MRHDFATRSISEPHQSYSGAAERQLRSMVTTGVLSSGDRLNELELSEVFQISRGPIREAIQRLAAEGLLEIRPHRGAVVRSFDRSQLHELFGLRIALETFAVREGAAVASNTQFAVLAELLKRDTGIRPAETTAASEEVSNERSFSFHRSIVLLAGNSALLEAHSSVMQKLMIAGHRAPVEDRRARQASSEHREILEALSRRDGSHAAFLVEAHIRGAFAYLTTHASSD